MTGFGSGALAALSFALLPAATGGEAKLPTLDHALRCAALTETAAGRPGLAAQDAEIAFDHAIFWGMRASEMARLEKRPSDWFTNEQKRRAIETEIELSDPSSPAHAELRACQAEVPKLRRASRPPNKRSLAGHH